MWPGSLKHRLAPVFKTIFHQMYHITCSQSNSDGSVLSWLCFKLKTEPSELDWLQVYDMTH